MFIISISVLYFGAPKIWYVVPAEFTDKVIAIYAKHVFKDNTLRVTVSLYVEPGTHTVFFPNIAHRCRAYFFRNF